MKLQQLINLLSCFLLFVCLFVCLFLVSQKASDSSEEIDLTGAQETKGPDSSQTHSPIRPPSGRAAAVEATVKLHQQLQSSPESSISPSPPPTSTSFEKVVDESVNLLRLSAEYKHLADLCCSPVFRSWAKPLLLGNFEKNDELKSLWSRLGVAESERGTLRLAVAASLIEEQGVMLQRVKADPVIIDTIAKLTADRHINRCEYGTRTVESLSLRDTASGSAALSCFPFSLCPSPFGS